MLLKNEILKFDLRHEAKNKRFMYHKKPFVFHSDGTTDVTRTFHFGDPTATEIVRSMFIANLYCPLFIT